MEPLNLKDLSGTGPKTADKLRTIKINKIKELKKLSESKLGNMFGTVGKIIYERAQGAGRRPVTSEGVIKQLAKNILLEKRLVTPKSFSKILKV